MANTSNNGNQKGGRQSVGNVPLSPTKRKAIVDIKIPGTKSMRKSKYQLKTEALCGNLEVYWAEIDAYNDAFLNHLHKVVNEGTDPLWHQCGFLLVARRRDRHNANEFLTNRKDKYPRKVMVRLLGPDEVSTSEGRNKMMKHIQKYCMHPSNNRFEYEYVIDKSSDLTPPDKDHYAKADSYLQDFVISNIIQGAYEDIGPNWYNDNKEVAEQYWSGPVYPEVACTELGYPKQDNSNSTTQFVETYNYLAEEDEKVKAEKKEDAGLAPKSEERVVRRSERKH